MMRASSKSKLRARSESSRASVGLLNNFLLETTSASRVITISASKRCHAVRSKFSSALVLSSSVAFPSQPALVTPCCVSAPSSVSCADFSSFFAFARSVFMFSGSVFVVSISSFQAFDSAFDSSSFVVSALISSSALALVSAFAVASCRFTPLL